MNDIDLSDHDLDVDSLERVIRHSSDSYARACAWTLLDKVGEEPDLADLEEEIRALRENEVIN